MNTDIKKGDCFKMIYNNAGKEEHTYVRVIKVSTYSHLPADIHFEYFEGCATPIVHPELNCLILPIGFVLRYPAKFIRVNENKEILKAEPSIKEKIEQHVIENYPKENINKATNTLLKLLDLERIKGTTDKEFEAEYL